MDPEMAEVVSDEQLALVMLEWRIAEAEARLIRLTEQLERGLALLSALPPR